MGQKSAGTDSLEQKSAGRNGTPGLARWLSLSVGLLVLAGSLSLLLVFRNQARREAVQALASLTAANAAFLDRGGFPATAQFAGQLGDVLETRVFLQTADGTWLGAPDDQIPPEASRLSADGTVHFLSGGLMACAAPLRRGGALLLLRPQTAGMAALRRTDTWLALGAFWTVALAAGAILARRVTGPLSQIAAALPGIAEERRMPPLPVGRQDEIGSISRALTETHAALTGERELRRSAERLAVLGRMAASLAHEVRNPASAIRLHAQLLEGAVTGEAETSRQCIEADADRIEELVSQWMTFARPEPPRRAAADLRELIRQGMERMAARAAHSGVLLECAAGEPVPVQVDRVRMGQALGNVLLNAVQASPRGGTVRISARPGSMAAITVTDEGSGFSAEALARGTEAFFSEKEGGMGLGLAVAAEVCRSHGGRLLLQNAAAGGAALTLEITSE